MTDDKPDCHLCQSRHSMLEHLRHGWWFCNGCGSCFQLDENGELVASAVTLKTKVRKDVASG